VVLKTQDTTRCKWEDKVEIYLGKIRFSSLHPTKSLWLLT